MVGDLAKTEIKSFPPWGLSPCVRIKPGKGGPHQIQCGCGSKQETEETLGRGPDFHMLRQGRPGRDAASNSSPKGN